MIVVWDVFGVIFSPFEEGILEIVKELHKLDITQGVCSNMSRWEFNRLVTFKDFDFVFLSDEVGFSKPSKEIFEKVHEYGDSFVLIDDKQRNCDFVKDIGWSSICFNGDVDSLKSELFKLLNIGV